MPAVDPTGAQIKALSQSAHEGPVQMINLLQFRPDGGVAGYERYAQEVQPHLDAVGARVVAMSAAHLMVIGEDERPWWDAILTVEYPSIGAFLRMVGDPAYQQITSLRTDALTRAELIATVPNALST